MPCPGAPLASCHAGRLLPLVRPRRRHAPSRRATGRLCVHHFDHTRRQRVWLVQSRKERSAFQTTLTSPRTCLVIFARWCLAVTPVMHSQPVNPRVRWWRVGVGLRTWSCAPERNRGAGCAVCAARTWTVVWFHVWSIVAMRYAFSVLCVYVLCQCRVWCVYKGSCVGVRGRRLRPPGGTGRRGPASFAASWVTHMI